jgi:hypothetical protein
VADAQILEPVLLEALAKQGIAANNVELRHDYAPRSRGKEYSPYARYYRDTVSGKNFAVVAGLPGCDAYGQSHELVWSDKNGVIENGNNIFHSVIDKGAVRMIALSDQPTGMRKDDEVTFHPQLFIDGVEILPLSDTPKLINDPLNVNYTYNTLEWDYGVCLRRIRLIEGRFLGSWVFTTNPQGEVFIRYNQSGELRLRLQYAKGDDTEFIPKTYFEAQKAYPVTVSDSATFYPDANPEISSVDGIVGDVDNDNMAWSTLVAQPGSYATDSDTWNYIVRITASYSSLWAYLIRGVLLFDTSSLPDEASISAATLSFYGYGKYDGLSVAPDINIYSSAPASNTALAAGDFDSLGSPTFCDTPVTFAGYNDAGYNDFALNTSGIAAIFKNGVSKFGVRNANYDAANIEPSWSASGDVRIAAYMSEQGVGYQPKLVVTYTTGITERASAETGSGAEVITSGHPIVVSSVTETGSGLESLVSRGLGQTETGSGLDYPGNRDLGCAETGSGLDISSLLAGLCRDEAGSSTEAGLKLGVLSADSGLGTDISWMQKEAVSADGGGGADALKMKIEIADSNSDMRLYERLGQAGIPSKKARMPHKGVNK